ncbi:AraC family transcriptional regulator [Vibrio algarum]|uniref:AraC family transcriptional regulator n=1 Tax=Vibrio algarum TaxID=3020714 RepID=A0ABT4YRJ7_9VIBR|nr:AraC family transcriptional regulator [Vibrio sp. KJ40-1]MDB1123674.1 AraC family transcriptional regulator [Vibrio sp. KJ40-1]
MSKLAHYMDAYINIKQLHNLEGLVNTAIPGVKFYRSGKARPREPLLYESGIIVVGQGIKHIYLGEHKMTYGQGDFVVLGVPLPLECESETEENKPIMGLKIDIAPKQLHSIISHIDQYDTDSVSTLSNSQLGVTCMSMSDPLEEAYLRLMKVLQIDSEAEFLGADIVKEITYRVLKGPMGHILFERANSEGNYAKLAKVLDLLHSNYASPLTVDDLAAEAFMSVPAFHRVFKQVTTESPLQYLKKVRLSKARDLIMLDGYRASEAARMVGYNSASQFSREFKRHFNYSPGTSHAHAV